MIVFRFLERRRLRKLIEFGERNGIAGERSRAYAFPLWKESAGGYSMCNRFNLFVQKSKCNQFTEIKANIL